MANLTPTPGWDDVYRLEQEPAVGGPGGVMNFQAQALLNRTEQLKDDLEAHGHDNATTGAAGFMSAADKTKLDGIDTGATATPLSSSAPAALGVAAAGVSTSASRADHVHAMPSASDVGAMPAALTITTVAGTSRTLGLSDALAYLRFTSATAVSVLVPTNAAAAFPIGTQINLRQAAAGQITIAGDTGVTVNTAETLKTRKNGSLVTLVKVATDTWDLLGDMEAV